MRKSPLTFLLKPELFQSKFDKKEDKMVLVRKLSLISCTDTNGSRQYLKLLIPSICQELRSQSDLIFKLECKFKSYRALMV